MKKNWWRGLQVKIIAWSFVPTVIILSAVAWFTFYSYQKVIGDLAIKQDQEIAAQKAGQLLTAYTSLVNPFLIPIFAETGKNYAESLEVRAQTILTLAQGGEVFDGGIYFLDQQGVIFKTSPDQPEMIGKDWSNTPHFRSLKSQWNSAVFTDLISIGSAERQVLCSGMAMPGQNLETVGAVYFCSLVFPATDNTYYQQMNSLDLDEGIFLLDRYLNVIYSRDPAYIGENLSGKSYIQQLAQAENQSGRFRIDGKEMVVSYLPMSSAQSDILGWVVLKEQSWAEIMQPTLGYRQLLLILLALGVIVPVLVTAYGVRRITEPIQKLIHAARQVTAGQFKHKIEANTGDEIETLADQFNIMSAKLDDSYTLLEKKVTDRTRELATMNSIISVASHSLNIQEILEDALNMTVEQIGFEAGAALKIESDHTSTALIASRGIDSAVAEELATRFTAANHESTAESLPAVKLYEVGFPKAGDQSPQVEQSGFSQILSVPLSTKGRILGFFLLANSEQSSISQDTQSLLGAVGQQIGVAMENAQLYEQAEQAAIAAERNRLARELHDAVTQTLFSASLIADVIPRIWKRDPDEGMQNLEELRQLTRGALAEMRTMLLEMRPESIERPDLKVLITQLADAFIGRVRVPVSLDFQGSCEMSREVKIVFYRVAQEALNNIAKHSGARQVDVHVDCRAERIWMVIKDDGLGFDIDNISPGHMGISIMRERASSIGAILKVDSQAGLGTTIELEWGSARKE